MVEAIGFVALGNMGSALRARQRIAVMLTN
jgi:hypothetical protein